MKIAAADMKALLCFTPSCPFCVVVDIRIFRPAWVIWGIDTGQNTEFHRATENFSVCAPYDAR